jgi:hypothetical protein
MKKQPVPVFMYHTIGVPNKNWKWNYLTTPYQDFEKELIYLKKNGYSTINLEELFNYIHNDLKIPEKSVVLTFDDGYADNYIFAYPLLKQYGFKGTIFVNPEFVDPRNIIRKRFDESKDVINKDTTGFLSWQEMKIIEEDMIFDIQSHAMTHTWYPTSNKIINFRTYNDENCWMTWNNYPEKKPFLQLDNKSLIKLGEPVYENEKSLMASRFFPNEELKDYLIEYVNNNGEEKFFNKSNWMEVLFKEKDKIVSENNLNEGHYESESERLIRIKKELSDSKNIIEKKLNKKVDFLCWPGGSGTKEGQLIAEELGYKMTTAARDIKPDLRKKIKNDGEIYSNRIGRTSTILFETIENGIHRVIYSKGFVMKLRILAFKSYSIKRIFFAGLIIIVGEFNNFFKRK